MTQPSVILYDWTGAPIDRLPDRIQSSASAFILNEQGHVLLQLRQDNHHWALPGGRQDVGESITQTCVREVWEETGLRVRVKRLIGIYSDPTQFLVARYPSGEVVQICNVCFECEIIGGQIAISSESIDIGFYPPDELPEPILLTHKIRIQDALANASQPFLR
ncbi:MAG: NUDIX domain-containing protein [Candidatus Brachytrichaceae bacterium NZ_4S206]|jgi:8-oxo-dGTP pyrophosphatase MutT (NUDIX family)